MFCKKCGQPIKGNLTYCPNCGTSTAICADEPVSTTNTLAVIGFILSFFVGIAGLICSIIAYKRAPKRAGAGGNLSVAGIVIGILNTLVETTALILIALTAAGIWSIASAIASLFA